MFNTAEGPFRVGRSAFRGWRADSGGPGGSVPEDGDSLKPERVLQRAERDVGGDSQPGRPAVLEPEGQRGEGVLPIAQQFELAMIDLFPTRPAGPVDPEVRHPDRNGNGERDARAEARHRCQDRRLRDGLAEVPPGLRRVPPEGSIAESRWNDDDEQGSREPEPPREELSHLPQALPGEGPRLGPRPYRLGDHVVPWSCSYRRLKGRAGAGARAQEGAPSARRRRGLGPRRLVSSAGA